MEYLKKLCCAILCVAALTLTAKPEDFEAGALPEGWKAGAGSTLKVSDLRAKSGERSLQWTWQKKGAQFSCTFPEFEVKNDLRFGAWMHLPKPLESSIGVTFYHKNQNVAEVRYNVSFQGWQTIALAYIGYDIPKGTKIDRVTFTAPEDIAAGTISFDYVDFEWVQKGNPFSIRDMPRKPFTLPAYSYHDITKGRPFQIKKIPASQMTAEQKKDLDTLTSRFVNFNAYNYQSNYGSFEKLTEEFNALKITEKNGIVKGPPLAIGGAFYGVPNSINFMGRIMPLFRKLGTAYAREKGDNKTKAAEMYVLLSKHFLDQGFQEGNFRLGWLGNGYDWRHFPPAVYNMRGVLADADILVPMLKTMFWLNGGERAVMSTPGASLDDFHNMNIHLMRAAVLLPDLEERYLYARLGKRYYDGIIERNLPFFNDGAMHHHSGHHMSYGSYAIETLLNQQLARLNGTEFAISDTAHAKLRNVLWANHMQAFNRYLNPTIVMRAGANLSVNVENIARTMARMPTDGKDHDPFAAGVFMALCKNQNDKEFQKYKSLGIKPLMPWGHHTINTGAIAFHRRNNWMVSMSGMTDAFRCLEIYGWMESNNYGRLARNGAVMVNNNGKDGYNTQGWNQNMWPGTTVMTRPSHELFEGYTMIGAKTRMAGGTTLDDDGIWGYYFRGEAINFKKSAFCFGDKVTVVTSEIIKKDKRDAPIITTLLQQASATDSPIAVNGEIITDQHYDKVFAPGATLTFRDLFGNGYYVVSEDTVRIKRQTQQWTYMFKRYLLNKSENPCTDVRKKQFKVSLKDAEKYYRPTEGFYNLAYIEHGLKPTPANHTVYTILPDASEAKLNAFAKAMQGGPKQPIQLLQADHNAHILYDRESKSIGYVIFNPKATLAKSPVAKLSHAGFLLLRDAGDKWQIAFASSDERLHSEVTLQLTGHPTPIKIKPNYPCTTRLEVPKQ